MSGQQIGSFVGGVIGAYYGGPYGYAIGSAIGGAIGGYVDPTIIKGPKLSDATQQTASDGVPIPWGHGTFPTTGNIIWTSELKEKKKEDDGKGTGIVNVTYHYYRSYAIGICQGLRQDDGTYIPIAGILQVKRNGKIVYDVSPDASAKRLGENSKFLRRARFYLGSEDQAPDSVIESVLGVDNASAFPGIVYMVVENEELTNEAGSIPQYEFVVSTQGEVSPYTSGIFWASHLSRFKKQEFPLAENLVNYTYKAEWPVGNGGGVSSPEYPTLQEALDWISTRDAKTGASGTNVFGVPNYYVGYVSETQVPGGNLFESDITTSALVEQDDPEMLQTLYLVYQFQLDYEGKVNARAKDMGGFTQLDGPLVMCNNGGLVRKVSEYSDPYIGIPTSGGEDPLEMVAAVYVTVYRKLVAPSSNPGAGAVQIPDAEGYWVLPNGEVVYSPDFESVSGDFRILTKSSLITSIDDRNYYTFFQHGPAIRSDDPLYDSQVFWDSVYEQAVDLGEVPEGWEYGNQYPVGTDYAFRHLEIEAAILDRTIIPLATIIADVCRRTGLEDEDFDVSQITDLVDGFKVATESTGEAIIAPLMAGFFFDAGEWDDKIRFIKRGGDVVAEVDASDLCESDGDMIEETELQEAELLRKVHVRSIDPDSGFIVTTQTAERRTSTVLAQGEQTTEIPVVTDKNTQARMADKKLKVGWSETRRFKTAIPYTRPDLTVTDVIGLTDAKGRRQRVRLMEMNEDSGRIEIDEAMLDRQSSYTSNVEGVQKSPPADTSPGLIGPTYFVPMNLPSLRTQDNVPGIYIAASGYTQAWGGAAILLSADGGLSYQQVASFIEPSSMGILKADIGASGEPMEVFMNSGTLSTITPEQIALRMNAWAVTTNSVSEIGQFRVAEQGDGGIYDLTELSRGGLGTLPAPHLENDAFVMVASAKFLPLDIGLAHKTLYFKAVSYGTSADDTPAVPFVFNPLFVRVVTRPITVGGEDLTVGGQQVYVTQSDA